MTFKETAEASPALLMEGSVVERIRRHREVDLDPHIANAALIFSERGRQVLEAIYREYLDIGQKHGLPMIALTPTWRANRERLDRSIFRERRGINEDCFRFLDGIRGAYPGGYSSRIFIGGLMGCRGDAYDPGEALPEDEALHFHAPQAGALAEGGVDFLLGSTLPALSEALGLARAMARSAVPYVLSFVIRPDGTLLDGTPLHAAMDRIDVDTDPEPFFYMVNCVHPSVFAEALARMKRSGKKKMARLLGFQGNTSTKSPEELDGLSSLETEDPAPFAEAMAALHRRFGVRILGGCCGTDQPHIEALAERLSGASG